MSREKRSNDYFSYVFSKIEVEHKHAMENMTMYDIREVVKTEIPEYEEKFPIELLTKPPSVIERDCLDVAKQNFRKGEKHSSRPCVVVNASDRTPGGGWRGNNVAQEESICRCSTLGWYLENFVVGETPVSPYPLRMYDALYVPNVCVFMKRDTGEARNEFGRDVKFSLLPEKEWFFIDAIVIAATRHSNASVPFSPFAHSLTKLKIQAMFHLAALWKTHTLVLGAFGCGVFRNPVDEIVKIFNSVREKYSFLPIHYIYAVLGEKNFSEFQKHIK